MNELIIYGAGSMGKMVLQLINDINVIEHRWTVTGFIDDDPGKWNQTFLGYEIRGGIDVLEQYSGNKIIIAFSDPELKCQAAEKLDAQQAVYATIVHPTAWMGERVTIGEGSVLYPGSCIDVDVNIGRHTTINKNATIGHDTMLGDYVTVSPGGNLGGHNIISDGVAIGIGAVTIQNIKIGAWSTVGAGAVVLKDLPGYCTAVGVPAKPRTT